MASELTIEKNIQITENSEKIWSVISDINNWSVWNPSIDHAVLYGQFAEGSKFRLTSGKWDFDCIIGKIESHKIISINCKTMGLVISLTWEITNSALGSKVQLIAAGSGFLISLIRNKTAAQINEILDYSLNSLKIYCEKRQIV